MSPKKSENSKQNNLINYNLFNELKDDSAFFQEIANTEEKMDYRLTMNTNTPKNIIIQILNSEPCEKIQIPKIKNEIEKENLNMTLKKRLSKLKIEIPKLDFKRASLTMNNYNIQQFFFLTFQSKKLNCEDNEPFLFVFLYLRIVESRTIIQSSNIR